MQIFFFTQALFDGMANNIFAAPTICSALSSKQPISGDAGTETAGEGEWKQPSPESQMQSPICHSELPAACVREQSDEVC